MSLGVVFKGPEGIVLAADSRVTLNMEMRVDTGKILIPSTYDSATKLLEFQNQKYVGAVTYGIGAIGQKEPRTAHSFLPEFENELQKEENKRLSVEEFAKKLSLFFARQWEICMPKEASAPDLVFFIGGYDQDVPYGRVFQVAIPSKPVPVEQNKNQFGITWGGQLEYTTRLIKGMDPALPSVVQKYLNLTDEQRDSLEKHIDQNLSIKIPYQFLPLQDCVSLSIFLIRTSIEIQTWTLGIRGVGGAIDVATVTRTEGFKIVQKKKILGQFSHHGD
ncbi:MAG: hypothetical protein WAU81_12615 [Candidatus Aminicenantales bacterium]